MFDSIIVLIYIVCAIYSGNKIVSGRVEWLDRKQPANMIVKGVLILLIGSVVAAFFVIFTIFKFVFAMFNH